MKIILDNGHGGMINGEYQTKGKRGYHKSTGNFYEGEYNIIVVNKLIY